MNYKVRDMNNAMLVVKGEVRRNPGIRTMKIDMHGGVTEDYEGLPEWKIDNYGSFQTATRFVAGITITVYCRRRGT